MSIIGGILSSVAGSAASSLFGGKGGDAPQANADGLSSAMQGSNVPPPATPAKTTAFGSQAMDLMKETASEMLGGAKDSAVNGIGSIIGDKITGGAGKQGRNARDYLDNAFPELNPWEKAGAGASGIGASTGEDNSMKMKRMELKNAKEIAGIQSSTAIKTAQISSAPGHERNVLDTPRIEADISRIYAQGSLTREQASHEVFKTYLTQLQATGQKVNTQKVKAEIDNIVAKTFNERYASSTPGKIAKDLGLLLHDNVNNVSPVPSTTSAGLTGDTSKKPNYHGK